MADNFSLRMLADMANTQDEENLAVSRMTAEMPQQMPQNWVQRGNDAPIDLGPSQGMGPQQGPALDYSRPPVSYGGQKGYYVKGDPFTVVMQDGTRLSLGNDQAATRKRTLEELQMAKARQELEQGGVDSQLKRAQLDQLTNPKKAAGFSSMKEIFDAENKLADDHKAQAKTFIDVRDAYSRLDSAMDKATTSAPAALAGATVFMKLLDPGSVVRESELGMALAATGALDRVQNYYNVLKNGKVLTPSQAKEFKAVGDQLYAAAETNQKQLDQHYTGRAKAYGLDPGKVVGDYYLKKKQEAAQGTQSVQIPGASGFKIVGVR